MNYSRYERFIDPSIENVALDERDMFGKVSVPDDAETEYAVRGYERELLNHADALRSGRMKDKDRDTLFESGFQFAEQLQMSEQATIPPGLGGIEAEVREAFEVPVSGKPRNASAFSLVGTPLHKVFGFSGCVKYTERGKSRYVPFEYVPTRQKPKEFANVQIPELPNPLTEQTAFHKVISQAGRDIVREFRNQQRSGQTREKHVRW